MATAGENKTRLDNHAERLRAVELRLGRNNIVSETACRERQAMQEARMSRVERKAASVDLRIWGLLVIALATLLKVALG